MDQLTREKKPASGARKVFRTVVIVLIIGLIGFFAVRYYFVWGYGAKAGTLNFIVKKGYIWKTWEGRMILAGYRSNQPGGIQSNEFQFSVVNEKVANTLMSNSGAFFELHYKEYLGAVPWRGMSEFIVDSIISMRKIEPGVAQPLP